MVFWDYSFKHPAWSIKEKANASLLTAYKTMEPSHALMPLVLPLCPWTIVHYTILGLYIDLLLITIRINYRWKYSNSNKSEIKQSNRKCLFMFPQAILEYLS